MKCPKCIFNLVKAIYTQPTGLDGLERFLATVQRSGILGIHIIRFPEWTESSFVAGIPDCFWLFDGNGLSAILDPGSQELCDRISSPFPRLSFCKIAEKRYGINYVCGPLAGRGLVAKEVFRDGKIGLEPSNADMCWAS